MIILTDNKSVTRFFQTKIIPPPLWKACDFVVQFHFTIAHIPGENNTAADYLSRLEIDPRDKLVLKIREDIETTPIEVNVQSFGISEEEQIFFTNEDELTEDQLWAKKKAIREKINTEQATITIESLSVNQPQVPANFNDKLVRTNQIVVEQSKDPIILNFKLKL